MEEAETIQGHIRYQFPAGLFERSCIQHIDIQIRIFLIGGVPIDSIIRNTVIGNEALSVISKINAIVGKHRFYL